MSVVQTNCFLFMYNDNVLSVEDDAENLENKGSNVPNYNF